jgi:hypothetical protein
MGQRAIGSTIGSGVLTAIVLAALIASPARSAGLALVCAKADVIHAKWNVPIKFVFNEGASSGGTLAVSGPFGDFSIPAKREPMPVEPGVTGEAIDGVANARVKLPAVTELKACIAKTSDAASAQPGSDAYLNAQQDCLGHLEPSEVDAVAEIRLGTVSDGDEPSGEDAFVTFKLRYEAAEADGKIVVEAFPAQCAVQK